MAGEKEGDYCTVCGGIKPETIKIRTILVDGKATGINQLEVIIDSVRKLRLEDDAAIRAELLERTGAFNYIPTKKRGAYGDALMHEYKATSG
ncbi:MAG: NAC family transcription factor [Methanoculleus sp.]|jgi:hypothetical protein|nr:NAC family transcription factor [Methanomicrobiales archaeon]NQS73565.1 NAC family transcription factor [Methanoculleus sp.]